MKSFVKPPIEDRLVSKEGYLTDIWREWFIDTWQSMDELASEAGLIFPRLTSTQRDSNDVIDQTALANGQLDGIVIYNTTTNKLQTYTAFSGTWNDLF
jgi:hypothetical protein